MVLGAASGISLTAFVDEKEISLKMPYNDTTLAMVEGLAVGWHVLSLVIRKVHTMPDKSIGSGSRSTSLGNAALPVTPETDQRQATISEGIAMATRLGTMALDRVIIDTGLSEWVQ